MKKKIWNMIFTAKERISKCQASIMVAAIKALGYQPNEASKNQLTLYQWFTSLLLLIIQPSPFTISGVLSKCKLCTNIWCDSARSGKHKHACMTISVVFVYPSQTSKCDICSLPLKYSITNALNHATEHNLCTHVTASTQITAIATETKDKMKLEIVQ